MTNRASVHRLADLPVDHPMPLIDRRRIIGEQMMISAVTLHAGFSMPAHQHFNEQFVVLLKGTARFTVGEDRREILLRGGEVLHLPANVPHACVAVTECTILDLFSPPSATTGVDRPGGA